MRLPSLASYGYEPTSAEFSLIRAATGRWPLDDASLTAVADAVRGGDRGLCGYFRLNAEDLARRRWHHRRPPGAARRRPPDGHLRPRQRVRRLRHPRPELVV